MDLRLLEQERDLQVLLGGLVGHPVVERDQILPPALDPRQALELGGGAVVTRIVAQGARVGVEGLGRIVATDLVQLGDLVQQLDLARRIEGVARHDLVDADLLLPAPVLLVDRLEDAGDRQLVLAAGGAQQSLEGGDGLGVGRVELEDLAVGVDRGRRLAQVGLAQAGQAVLQLDPLAVVVAQDELPGQVVAQVLPELTTDVEPIERAQGRQVVGVGRQHLAVGADRLGRLVEHLLVDGRDPEQDLEPLLGGLGQLGLLAVDLEQLAVLIVAGEDDLEGVERGAIVGLELEGLLEEADGAIALPQALLVVARDVGRQLVDQRRR